MRNEADEKAWGTPAVGFSSGADPLYPFYKEDIGGFFLTPIEWFETAHPEIGMKPDELTMIGGILPQTEAPRSSTASKRNGPTRDGLGQGSTAKSAIER